MTRTAETGGSRQDPREWHGHRIVTEDDLGEVFRADSDDAGRPRRSFAKVRHGIVLGLLVALVAGAVWAALALARGDLEIPGWSADPDPAPEAVCPAEQLPYPATAGITVNVYNATRINGLAGDVAAALKERGYLIGEVGNRSLTTNRIAAAVVSGPEGRPLALNLQRNIVGTEYIDDARAGASVDVVVGTGYQGLVPLEQVQTVPGQLSCPRLSPNPVDPAPVSPAP